MTGKEPWFGRRAKRWTLVTVGVLLVAAILGRGYLREGRAWYDGLQAYLYGFPLVVMDLTKAAGTAVPTAGEIAAPVNQFAASRSANGAQDYEVVNALQKRTS